MLALQNQIAELEVKVGEGQALTQVGETSRSKMFSTEKKNNNNNNKLWNERTFLVARITSWESKNHPKVLNKLEGRQVVVKKERKDRCFGWLEENHWPRAEYPLADPQTTTEIEIEEPMLEVTHGELWEDWTTTAWTANI